MLHILLLASSVVATTPKIFPRPPLVGAQCAHSLSALGTGNVPVSSGRQTSVVNISLVTANGKSVAWIYKNFSGQYWIQINSLQFASKIRGAFPAPLAKALLTGASAHSLPIPQRMPNLGAYDRYFSKFGASRSNCFTHDLPAKYL